MYSKYGVPILRDTDIEQKAYNLLSKYDESLLDDPMETPIAGILNFLQKDSDLKISFTKLEAKTDEQIILGRTYFPENMICIDKDIVYENKPLFLFTTAHEIGHWMLHRNHPIKKEITDQMDDHIKKFGRKKLESPIDWIEHHANVFAASLLMPPIAFKKALIAKQKHMGIERRLGQIFLDDQPKNQLDFEEIISNLQAIFGTSKKTTEIRLKELDLVIDRSKRLRLISECFYFTD